MVYVHAPRYTNVGRILEKGYEHMFCRDTNMRGGGEGYMMAIGTCEHTFICRYGSNVCSHTGHAWSCDAWSIANVCSDGCFYSNFVVEM